jgi:hypothetical protein
MTKKHRHKASLYLCPVCGETVSDTGHRATNGRVIATCGDAHKPNHRQKR